MEVEPSMSMSKLCNNHERHLYNAKPLRTVFLQDAACVPRRSRAKLFVSEMNEKTDFPNFSI